MKKDFLVFLFLLFIPIIFFWKAATLQGIFITGDTGGCDITDLNYPIKTFVSETLKTGKFPLWLPYNYCGFPIFAYGEAGVLYPFNLILTFLPPLPAYNYSTLLVFFMAGLFTYIYARSLDLSRESAMASALIYMFCGFFITHTKHINMITVTAWMPLMFYFIEKMLKTKIILHAFFIGIIFALQILIGHPQATFYSMIGIVTYCILRFFSIKNKEAVNVRFIAIAWIIIILTGIGLSAVQIIPSNELVSNSIRVQGLVYEEVTFYSYHPKDLITLVFPYFYGDPAKETYLDGRLGLFWEKCAYVGIIPLLLIIFSFFKLKRNKLFVVFSGISIISLLLAMGKYTPLLNFIYFLPGFSYFQAPSRFLFVFDFSLAVLAGISLDYWLIYFKDKIPAYILRVIMISVILIIILDLFAFGINHNPVVSKYIWFQKPETVNYLEKDQSAYRVYSYMSSSGWQIVNEQAAHGWSGDLSPFNNYRNNLRQNANILYHISDAYGYGGIRCRRQQILFRFIDQALSQGNILGEKMLGLLNVKYVISMFELKNMPIGMQTNFKWSIPQIKVYENPYLLPRAYLVGRARYAAEGKSVFDALFNKDFNPRNEVIIEESIPWGSPSLYGSKVNISKYNLNEVSIDAELTNQGFLVLSDSYYPGWEVYIDGKQGKILQANYVMRAVPLQKGKHVVQFVYDPSSFKMGMFISGVSLLILFLILGWWFVKSRGIIKSK